MTGPFAFPPLIRGGRRSIEDMGIYILPQEFIPRNATFVDQTRTVATPTNGNVIAFSYKTPPNRRGRLARLAVETFDPAGIPFTQFSILRSGSPIPNYQNNDIPFGTIGVPDTVYAEIDREQDLQVQLQNSSVTSGFTTFVRIVFWHWDIQAEAGR